MFARARRAAPGHLLHCVTGRRGHCRKDLPFKLGTLVTAQRMTEAMKWGAGDHSWGWGSGFFGSLADLAHQYHLDQMGGVFFVCCVFLCVQVTLCIAVCTRACMHQVNTYIVCTGMRKVLMRVLMRVLIPRHAAGYTHTHTHAHTHII